MNHRVAPFAVAATLLLPGTSPAADPRPWIAMRGVYGGFPTEMLKPGETLRDHGVNAVFIGSGGITAQRVAQAREHGVRLFAEFNTMHHAQYLREHPDAAPVGPDGEVSPPPEGWQGVCPTHPGYRRERMETFAALARDHPIDGVWLDYHHAHASWERAEPILPDTCFCARCVGRFQADTGVALPAENAAARSRRLLDEHGARWVQWRCDIFTDWVREFREILDRARPGALLGTFHCPWDESERDGALRRKLAIDLGAQARYVDVFSPMPYHARFGHATDPGWISRQIAWLGGHLGIRGAPGERHRIWPIVQVSDWGETVPVEQVAVALDHGTRAPATGVMIFAWNSLRKRPEKIAELSRFYRAISPATRP